ncbi:MAG: hypothetical protein PHZ26_00345 [Candidatus Gracilibacteria bacterium]|nr:hypothetical protein [Candidatus Gracilibacteria bacterium]MDD2908186.1 hypothetical protein [Candidatus Gracilibacteria bacterium]
MNNTQSEKDLPTFKDIISDEEIDLMLYWRNETLNKMGITKDILTDILEGKRNEFEVSFKTIKKVKIILINGKTFPIIPRNPIDIDIDILINN